MCLVSWIEIVRYQGKLFIFIDSFYEFGSIQESLNIVIVLLLRRTHRHAHMCIGSKSNKGLSNEEDRHLS